MRAEERRRQLRASAYGGAGWRPRARSLQEEIGTVWGPCGVAGEWAPLRAVLLHAPGEELDASRDPDAVQMLAPLDRRRAAAQHDALAEAYRRAGVRVHRLAPRQPTPPNQMFLADLFFMTPAGAVLARPASVVRAGEERQVARRLADLGIPILRSVHGRGVFEGADAMWLDAKTVLLGRGLRTNGEGARQVAATLAELGVRAVVTDLPAGAMHLMGCLRIPDAGLAVARPGRLDGAALAALDACGYRVAHFPDEAEADEGQACNFVTLGPGEVLMPAGNPATRTFLERLGIVCHEAAVDELVKAAGAIGCLTGVLERSDAPAADTTGDTRGRRS